MASNAQIILDEILKQQKAALGDELTDSTFFEYFVAEQILKDFDLSDEEIQNGLIGNGGDGGIDAFYTLLNGELAHEDTDYSNAKRAAPLDVIIMQSKTSASFSETPVERFITASNDIFDLSKDTETLRDFYNNELIAAIEIFRSAYQSLASKFPKLKISFYYATKGSQIAVSVQRKVEMLRNGIAQQFSTAEFLFEFIGAQHLLDLARKTKQTTYQLTLAESPVASGGIAVAFCCLVELREYAKFITSSDGVLSRQLFESNVRDYAGKATVNEAIKNTLTSNPPEDFWWLNNGVTILASQAALSGKILTIEDPQIVNGLQSSTEIFNYCNSSDVSKDTRKVLVRVIVPPSVASSDRIIRATNSQTAVPEASLRATDTIHRDIEDHLKPKGLFYDRRKNYYKNEGQPRSKIIGIPNLAQAVMAIVLKQPNTARARPSSLLKNDSDYQKIFNASYPIEMYQKCASVILRVEDFLKVHATNLSSRERNNIKYYLAMHAVSQCVPARLVSAATVSSLDVKNLSDAVLIASLKTCIDEYRKLGGTDQVAKGPDLKQALT
ncbi:MAG: AIPR family protein [Hyphomicrobium sp.]